jgi:hypothetical protein
MSQRRDTFLIEGGEESHRGSLSDAYLFVWGSTVSSQRSAGLSDAKASRPSGTQHVGLQRSAAFGNAS